MAKTGHSDPNMFGGYTHYDEHGKKVGRSEANVFGGFTNYDAKGRKTGTSQPGIFGGYTTYDNKGHKIGTSEPGAFGGFTHRDASGRRTGSSDPTAFGGYTHKAGEQGCYIATCVYGSYDCPPVWRLRRFRDGFLAKSAPGRLLIRGYYTASPHLVRSFGHRAWFRRIWRTVLDRMVRKLERKGVSADPYRDREW